MSQPLEQTARLGEQHLRYEYRTYSGKLVALPFADPHEDRNYSAKDIANHLGHIFYFPESTHAPFSAAQYAVELAKSVWTKYGPIIQLHALLRNAFEAYAHHRSPLAELAEKALTMPPLVTDRRDVLQETVQARVLQELRIPDLGSLTGTARNAILAAKAKLDVTLVRDIGAARIDHGAPDAQPLPRIIRPQPWDHAIERYLKTYRELTALCGLPAVE